MTQKQDTVLLRGGLDLVSPGILKAKGTLIGCQNYEADEFGYTRMKGYERFDGRLAPSEATYTILNFDAGTSQIFVGNSVVGVTSGFVGIVLSVTLTSGAWGAAAAGFLVLYNTSGAAIDNEIINSLGSPRATVNGMFLLNGSPTVALNQANLNAAVAARRAAMANVPGSGPVRGVVTLAGRTFCWRDNVGATACMMYEASPAGGWAPVNLNYYLKFDGATAEIFEGNTVTGLTSGATAVVTRVSLNTGTWAVGGAGVLAFYTFSGNFIDNEVLRVAGVNKAVADGIRVQITLPAGGKYMVIEHNFYAAATTNALYFCNGVGPAYEFKGAGITVIASPIFTGLSVALEKPTYSAEFGDHLFLGYATGSVQFSSIGEPTVFNAITGAGEIGLGQAITGMKSNTADSLIITTRNQVRYLTGTSAATFALKRLSDSSGAIDGTLEVVNKPLFVDDIGIRSLNAVQDYGDWKTGTETAMVQPWLANKKAAKILPVGALRVRSKDQLRLFYADGYVLLLYMGRKKPECTILKMGFIPSCVFSGEDADGNEVLFAGSTDGWVYQLDKGTSFDGANIFAYIRTSFMNQGMPRWDKRYFRCDIGAVSKGNASTISIAPDFSYGSPSNPVALETDMTAIGMGGYWDEFTWDTGIWDAAIETHQRADTRGKGENISVLFVSDSAVEEAHELRGLTLNYSPLRMLR